MAERILRRAGVQRPRWRAPRSVASSTTRATCIRQRTGPSAARRPPTTAPTKTSTTGKNLVRWPRPAPGAQHRVPRVVLGPLAGSPFPDARPEVLRRDGPKRCRWGLERRSTPGRDRDLHKEQVIQRGVELDVFELTLLGMNPRAGGISGAPFLDRRRVQQAQRTARCLRGGGRRRSTPYDAATSSRS